MKTYVVTPHLNRLNETVLMTGHNICFKGVIWKIIPKLSLLPLLSWSTDHLSIQCIEFGDTINHATCTAIGQLLTIIARQPSIAMYCKVPKYWDTQK